MSLTIQGAIDTLIASVPGAPFVETVDTIKAGDASQPLSGMVITFLATVEVLEKAVELGANLVITHEPIFYNHLDAADWLAQDPIYLAKRKLIEQNNLVIWRFHDYLHSIPPDNTVVGLVGALGWDAYASPEVPFLCSIPPMTFEALVAWVKEHLGLSAVRVMGDAAMVCEKINVFPGFPPPEMQIGLFDQLKVDVLVVGEMHEWEVNEYIRDSTRLGAPKALIVIGHAISEEPGVKRMLPWIQERLPGVDIQFVPTGQALRFL